MFSNVKRRPHVAMAWAGGLYIHSRSQGGWYKRCFNDQPAKSVPIYLSDATPNVGLDWAFPEWSYCSGGICCFPNDINYVYGNGYIRETTWKYRTDNIVGKYVHTYAEAEVSITVSSTPSITVSGTDKKWSTALVLSFTH